jgi:MFS family permease
LTVPAFRIRSFRFQWPADLLTSWAFEMETLILGWYVLVHTGSVLWLTAFGSLQFLGTLAAPMVGVLGDRLGGRVMLCAMRAIYAGLAGLLMLLALTGLLGPAWVLVVAALAGVVRPNDLVMRNTLIGETIPPAHLMGALGLSRATMDSARVGGALAGAGLSTVLDVGYTYVFVMSFYVASLALTFGVSRGRRCPIRARRRAGCPTRGPRAGATSRTASSASGPRPPCSP